MFLKRFLLVSSILFLALGNPLAASAHGSPPTEVAESALEWLKLQQLPDGGFSNGFSEAGDATTTAQAVVAGVLAGEDVSAWRPGSGGAGALDFLAERVKGGQVTGASETAWTAMAFTAAGIDPRQVGGHDLVADLDGAFDATTRRYGSGPGETSLALLALTHLGQAPRDGALDGLLAARLSDGSWSANGQATGDPVTTALGVLALVSSGRSGEIDPSLDFLHQSQLPEAGWSFEPAGQRAQTMATAFVIQALNAAHQDLEDWNDPVDFLIDLQTTDDSFLYDAHTPGGHPPTAAVAIPALLGASTAHLTQVPAAQLPSETVRLPEAAGRAGAASGVNNPTGWVMIGLAAVAVFGVAAWVWSRRAPR